MLSSLFVVLVLACLTGHAGATDVETVDGRHFSNCRVLKADGLGIYFRHSNGIARILYEDFSEELLAALGPLPEEEVKAPLVESRRGVQATDPPQDVVDQSGSGSIGALQLQFWQRVTYGVPEAVTRPLANCQMHRGRFSGVHRYSRFPCRQLAELDFLITAGILPAPAGVVTRRISHRDRYNYYF